MFAAKIQTLAHFINDSVQFGRQTGFDQNQPRDKWLIYLEHAHSRWVLASAWWATAWLRTLQLVGTTRVGAACADECSMQGKE